MVSVLIDDLAQPAIEELDLTTVLAALADPGRLETVRTLERDGESCCSTLRQASGLECTKSTMSHHLKVLREAGLTRTRVDGVRRYVTLRREDVDNRFPGLLDAVMAPIS
jgi:DNA-binding transcriptional ArsR family regulator